MPLAWTIYVSFLGAAALLLLPANRPGLARATALGTALLGLLFGVIGAGGVDVSAGVTTLVNVPWIPSLGIDYRLAVDGISLTMVILTGIASVTGILFSWNIGLRTKEFFAYYLALIGGCYGVFLSFDLVLLFVFYEIAIIPKYFLIAIWGSTNREFGAMKLALYSFGGSALVLIGILGAYAAAPEAGFNLVALAQHGFSLEQQNWMFPVIFVGFAVLAGMWPFHTWAPTGHVAAPTAASMLLAGVVMKLGAYGCLRVAVVLFPEGWQVWSSFLAGLAAIGIFYGGLIALTQKDFKFVIGYSSVSHMGFVLLGLLSLNMVGLQGAVLQMFSHGIIAGLLFAVVGRMVYDRTHTRDLNELQGRSLRRLMPFTAATFVIAGFASMGLPGFSGFVAELHVLMGAWQHHPGLALLAGLGVLVGVVYTLRAIQKAFFQDPALIAPSREPAEPIGPVTLPERVGVVMLIVVTVVVGVYPNVLLRWIVPALESPLFDGVRRGAGL